MSTNKSTDYINGLIGYILDIKPYHSKLSEVVEEYHFDDAFTVLMQDQHSIRAKLSSIWCSEYYSDGNRVLYKLPAPIVRPRYANEDSFHLYEGVTQHDNQILNLTSTHSAYQPADNDGELWVKVEGNAKLEGLDYYVSKGIFSFYTKTESGTRQWIEKILLDSGFNWWRNSPVWNPAPNWAPPFYEGISINPTAPDETWSLIKINPITYTRPIFVSGTLGLNDHYYWGYDIANYDSGGDDIDCVTDGPDADNYYVSGGYYAGELYDDRVHCFDLVNLNLTIIDPNAPTELWTVTAITATTFSVVGSVSGPQANATLNVLYNNGIISFTISATNPVFQAIPGIDVFYFYVTNPAPFINLHPVISWNCPAQTWNIVAINATTFSVIGSVSGPQANATVNVAYNNGLISFTIYSGSYVFQLNDTYTFNVIDPRPSYLVHGSVSGMQKPAIVGTPYNNGKIAFILKYPDYKLDTLNPLIGPMDFGYPDRISTIVTFGVPHLLSGTAYILFPEPPRFYAINETIKLKVITPTTISVVSSYRGMLKGAQLDVPYYDDYIAFTISGTLIPGLEYSLEVVPHAYDLYFGKHLTIFGETQFSGYTVTSIDGVVHNVGDEVEINTTKYDRIFINYSDPLDYPNEFGGQWTSGDSSIPFYIDGNGKVFPDKELQSNLNLDNIHPSYPAVTQVGQVILDGYAIEFDQNFINTFLPINTGFNICVEQQETYNNRVATTITDEIKFADSYRFGEDLIIQIIDSISFWGELEFSYLNDVVNITMGEKAYLPAGYDIEPYDEESYYNIINPPSYYDYSELIELNTSAPAAFRIYDNFNTNPYSPFGNDGDTQSTNISEAFVLYAKTDPNNFDTNSFDTSGFDTLEQSGEAIISLDQMTVPTIGHPFFMLAPASISYGVVDATSLGWTTPIKKVTIDYRGTPGLSVSPTVLIYDNLTSLTLLSGEPATIIPIHIGPDVYTSFEITLTVDRTDFVVVITA